MGSSALFIIVITKIPLPHACWLIMFRFDIKLGGESSVFLLSELIILSLFVIYVRVCSF